MAKRASLVFLIVALLRAEPLRAQTELNKKPIKPGETSTVTLKVEGTAKPVLVHVHNNTPEIVAVTGGNDQVVMSSGGEKNVVKLQITGLKPGNPSFSLQVDNTDPDTIFRQTLRKVIDDTRKRAAALESIHTPSGRQVYKLNEVLGVLQQIALDVDAAMPEREFAPFRDAIEDYIASQQQRAIRSAIEISPSIALVSYRTIANTRGVDKESADSIFREVLQLLDGTAERGRTRELCVHTTPTNFEVAIYPPSYPPDEQKVTASSLLTLTVGKYKYRIPRKEKNMESSGDLNLLLNQERVIECPVKFKDGDAEACRYIEGNARPCQ